MKRVNRKGANVIDSNYPDIVFDEYNHYQCRVCGTNIADLANVTNGRAIGNPGLWDCGLCECVKCHTTFYYYITLFDNDGHIKPKAFFCGAGKVRVDNWTGVWTKEQCRAISDHLEYCGLCQKRRDVEELRMAVFRSGMMKDAMSG